MIVVYHKNNRITKVITGDQSQISFTKNKSIAFGLMELAERFPESILVWCDQSLELQLNISEIESLFHHKKLLLSYDPSERPLINDKIGYVDASIFVQINKKITFPTWQMSSRVGCVHSQVLLTSKNEIPYDKDFNYYLCSLAKLSMSRGLLCYSEPLLLMQSTQAECITTIKTSSYTLFRFVKQHYKARWVFLLLFNLIVYELKFPFLPFLFSFFYKNRSKVNIDLDNIKVKSSKKIIDIGTIDVIIPTIGRKNYLFDVLKDFAQQTLLPQKIIIVEQNPDKESISELDYLTIEKWPFKIQHIFTHQAGACNARNLAMDQTQSEWVFLADDDIRIESKLFEKILKQINKFGSKAVSLKCFQKGEEQSFNNIFQWGSFGSGCSFVFADDLKGCKFKMGYEFGFGEDADFGMQLRNQGNDILYLPQPEILHLKAPIGGFRTKPVLQWHDDPIQPKPAPTVMLYQILHSSTEQINSYKTTLFFKYYKLQKVKNPVKYYITFQKQWNRSMFWATRLKKQ